MEYESYKKGEAVFYQGDFGFEMYEVESGEIGIYADFEGPGRKLLTRLGPGKTFGEMSILEDAPRSATAVALANTRLIVITKDTMESYFQTRPEQVLLIMKRMSRTLRSLTERYLDACRLMAEAEDAERESRPRAPETQKGIDEAASAYEALMDRPAGETEWLHGILNGHLERLGLGPDVYLL